MQPKPWDILKNYDDEVFLGIEDELKRQRLGLELIASENFASPQVIAAMGNIATNKYAEGRPGKRYYGGCQVVDRIENIAIERACKLFASHHANVQPHSGAQANAAVLLALAKPKDVILGMDLSCGGHLTHGSKVNFSGIYYQAEFYGVDPHSGYIDYDEVRQKALKLRPKVIVAGASAYPRIIDFQLFRSIADEVGAYLLVDMAHIAGLVVAGLHPSPMPWAHVVTTTTHKTLRGPRGGLILWKDDSLSATIHKGVFPGTQGGPLEHIIAAKAVCFKEAMSPSFRTYQEQVINNAKTLSSALVKKGFELVTNGTDNHLMLLNLGSLGLSGKDLEECLEKVAITVNKNTVPNETRSPFVTSGIRLGTPALTSRGMGEGEMKQIADFTRRAHDHHSSQSALLEIRAEVLHLASLFPLYKDWSA